MPTDTLSSANGGAHDLRSSTLSVRAEEQGEKSAETVKFIIPV
jgi:hypothetical protein